MKNILNQVKNRQAGFTIVELLVVIVVIGILASITIVAYNGVTARANSAAAKAAAAVVAKKMDVYNAEAGQYPNYNTSVGVITGTTSAGLGFYPSSSLAGSGVTVQFGAPTSSSSNQTVRLGLCTTASPTASIVPAGYIVYIWDAALTTPGVNPVQAGGNATLTPGATGVANTVACSGTSSTISFPTAV